MKQANIYLTFDGNCREAMTFYERCFQAETNLTPFSSGMSDMPAAAKSTPNRILHAELASGPLVIMAADSVPGAPFVPGNNFSISIGCDSEGQMERLFTALSENGKVTMPIFDAFWGGRQGILTDQFGIQWMFSFRG